MIKRPFIFLCVWLIALMGLPAAHAQDATPIDYGKSVSGRITNPDEAVTYQLKGRSGDVVSIRVDSAEDTYVRLADADGTILAENDDASATDSNPLLEYKLTKDGTYYIAVLGYSAGKFTLAVTNKNEQAPTSDSGNILKYGDSITGKIVDTDKPVIYTFQGDAGEKIVVEVASDVDTSLVLADAGGNTLIENDDASPSDSNPRLEFTLPAKAKYLIGVFGYDKGSFTVKLTLAEGGANTTVPVTDATPTGDVVSGKIDNKTSYVTFPLNGVTEGATITLEAKTTSGNLDVYLGLIYKDEIVAENDNRDQSTHDAEIIYRDAKAGDYSVVVTRFGFDKGKTTGSFDLTISTAKTSGSLITEVNEVVPPVTDANLSIPGYPTLRPTPIIAEWTILAYYGGDNNLEDGALYDMDEFERGGGSTDKVRILVLLKRSPEYDTSNGNWKGARIFEMGPDKSKDYRQNYPPTVDTKPIGDLGNLDTSYGDNLTNFLVWGMKEYPAKHYAVALNDHGGAWAGIIQDESTGGGKLLTLPDLQQSFQKALKATGVKKFDMLVNDACLMSSVEYYTAMSPYFNYAVSSPEIQIAPGFDMTLMTKTLNQQPNIDIGELGKMMVDQYMTDMQTDSPDNLAVLGAAVSDLSKFPPVTQAVDNFASIINNKPDAYASLIGKARTNSYAYSFFLPEDQYGPPTNIDLGDFMKQVMRLSKDDQLSGAAQNVLDALAEVRIYGKAGKQLSRSTSFYNIYFPASLADANGEYVDQTKLPDWTTMLGNYFKSVRPGPFKALSKPSGGGNNVPTFAPAEAPSVAPQVNITNVYPDEASIAVPATIWMEVTGRNISQGSFIVDQIQPDGSAIRLDRSRIITTIVEDDVTKDVNLWHPGVDDSSFTWEVTLATVTDGKTENYELVEVSDKVASLAGRYQYPGSKEWKNVTVIFDDNGDTQNVLSGSSTALGNVRLLPGGIFQAYRSVVSPDGQVTSEPGTQFVWPEKGISWHSSPAPSGQYRLGFLLEALGGLSGFNSTTVKVNNDNVDAKLRGYVDLDWGISYQRPADWFDVTYFPKSDFLQTSSRGDSNQQFLMVYPVYDAKNDLKAIAESVMKKFDLTATGDFKKIKVDGQDALEFQYTYSNSAGDYTGRAFAVYRADATLGLVFAAEAPQQSDTNTLYKLLQNTTTFFDAQAVKDKDTGVWESDSFTKEMTYPVRKDWLPADTKDGWAYYRPKDAPKGTTFAAATTYKPSEDEAKPFLDSILKSEVKPNKDGYKLGDTDEYFAENNTWAWAQYTYTNDAGDAITGRLYVTKLGNVPYALWFEAPSDAFDQTFAETFTVMLDGFKVEKPST